MKTYDKMVALFEKSNARFLERDRSLFINQVSERTLCGALMLHIDRILHDDRKLVGYHVDVEYNRNAGAIKTICKTIKGPDMKVICINCDLIVHSRGEITKQDNLIAIEMKKSTASKTSKNGDKERLMALTKDTFDDVWSFDGRSLPEHVCRYLLGVYYEIDFGKRLIHIEYYRKGSRVKKYTVNIASVFNSLSRDYGHRVLGHRPVGSRSKNCGII